ncbi:MAG: hypothetical protein P1S60_06025 [Anaerolineae bacterium]|nr:hypothetical protein [Anaerolineae bacterium]
MKRRLSLLALSLIAFLFLPASTPAAAQSYSFAVPLLKMQVYVQPDASVKIIYDITFDNYGSPIDIVDIGTPHSNYDLNNMRASINGVNLDRIYKSEFIDVGVEIHLGGQAIPTGQSGILHFEFTMPDMVYQDTTHKENASLQITPTWFDANSVQGSSSIQLAIHMIEGVEAESVVYQKVPFTEKVLFEGHVVALWQWDNVPVTGPRLVGISFQQDGMDRVVKMTLLDLTKKWLVDNPNVRVLLGIGLVVLFTFTFFRFTGGTGCTVFGIFTAIIILIFVYSPLSVLLAIPIFIGLAIYNETTLKNKRKKDYLPAVANVEGGGIKRGLTAPEAAVLIEMPLNKVLTLVIFGLLEKQLVKHVKDDPLVVEVAEAFQTWHNPGNRKSIKLRRDIRRKQAQSAGTVIHAYEHYFLDELERKAGKAVQTINFSKPMERLITLTSRKMKGFDLSDTQDYYRRIIDKAMEQASSLGEIEQRQQYLDKYLPWIMMNDNYPTVLTYGGYNYWPIWARRTYTSRALQAGPTGRSTGTSTGGRTTFGDVAASFSGWTESTMGGLAATIMPGSMNLPTTRGGLVDLSGVDRVTGDVFEALSKASSSSGKGRSGGSSCACACAGCACACACAGGGR